MFALAVAVVFCVSSVEAAVHKEADAKPTGPHIDSIEPSFGPRSGGTAVTLTGTNLYPASAGLPEITFTDSSHVVFKCTIQKTPSNSQIVILTPASTAGHADQNDTVELTLALAADDGTFNVSNKVVFVYKPDPVIFSVHPKSSIISGGITLTVVGEHLDSVAAPVLTLITMKAGLPQHDLRLQQSYFVNDTCIKFRTKNIDRHYVEDIDVSHDVISTNRSSNVTYVSAEPIRDVHILVGFIMDGVTYSDYTQLAVHRDPIIHPWTPALQTFVANRNEEINIDITWSGVVISADDVSIAIGSRFCSDVTMHEFGTSCQPPPLHPSIIRFGPDAMRKPVVTVSIGVLRVHIGSLTYTSSEDFHITMIIMIALLSFIFLITFIFGCITLCCSKKKSRKTASSSSDRLQGDSAEYPSRKTSRVRLTKDSYDVIPPPLPEAHEDASRFRLLDEEKRETARRESVDKGD